MGSMHIRCSAAMHTSTEWPTGRGRDRPGARACMWQRTARVNSARTSGATSAAGAGGSSPASTPSVTSTSSDANLKEARAGSQSKRLLASSGVNAAEDTAAHTSARMPASPAPNRQVLMAACLARHKQCNKEKHARTCSQARPYIRTSHYSMRTCTHAHRRTGAHAFSRERRHAPWLSKLHPSPPPLTLAVAPASQSSRPEGVPQTSAPVCESLQTRTQIRGERETGRLLRGRRPPRAPQRESPCRTP